MNHTIAFTAAPIITVFDDQGQIIQAFMLPLCLIFALPCRLYEMGFRVWGLGSIHARRSPLFAALRWAAYLPLSILDPTGWLDDLYLISQAALGLLFPQGNWGTL